MVDFIVFSLLVSCDLPVWLVLNDDGGWVADLGLAVFLYDIQSVLPNPFIHTTIH